MLKLLTKVLFIIFLTSTIKASIITDTVMSTDEGTNNGTDTSTDKVTGNEAESSKIAGREQMRTELPAGVPNETSPLTPKQIKENELFEQKQKPANWHKAFLLQQKAYLKLIPKIIKDQLSLKSPKFKPIFFGEKAELTVGDFNCDGSSDYAITGLVEKDIPTGLFEKSNIKRAELFKEFYIDYAQNKPALTVVILSGKIKEKFDFFKASYLRNGGSELPGCFDLQGEDEEKAKQYIKKNKCDFLYAGCCEKDGFQVIYEKTTTKTKYSSGC